ncbi:MAG: class I SAM-dependent methyltransferase [Candidatus Pacearchaeota archaeon]|nr:class I SAM-dependent methyltransferase [Candidatus Pacearchaeota archaeon]
MKESSNKDTTMSTNLIVKYFFRLKFNQIIRFANLKESDIILDFGCGDKWLKRIIPKHHIAGYDINPKQTEIRDYRKMLPNKIFAIDVFEHIPQDELLDIIKNFKRMGNFELIVCVPTENWISRKGRKLLGKRERAVDHITAYKKIKDILDKNFIPVKKLNFLTISYFLKYKNAYY